MKEDWREIGRTKDICCATEKKARKMAINDFKDNVLIYFNILNEMCDENSKGKLAYIVKYGVAISAKDNRLMEQTA